MSSFRILYSRQGLETNSSISVFHYDCRYTLFYRYWREMILLTFIYWHYSKTSLVVISNRLLFFTRQKNIANRNKYLSILRTEPLISSTGISCSSYTYHAISGFYSFCYYFWITQNSKLFFSNLLWPDTELTNLWVMSLDCFCFYL